MKNASIGLIFFIISLLGVPQSLAAQNSLRSDECDSASIFLQDTKHFMDVGLGLLAAPFAFDRPDWTRAGLIVGGTALLFTVDKSVKAFALRNKSDLNDAVFNMDSFYGDYHSVILAWGIYGYGALTGNNRIRTMGLHTAEAFIYSGMITGALKLLFGRMRPCAGDEHLFFQPFQFTNNDYQSLPSGHATVSFAVSTVLAKSAKNSGWKIFWYGTAGVVGASRIYHNKHWLSDVFLGAVIGYTIGDYVVGLDRKELSRPIGRRIQPYLGPNVVGLCLYLQ